MKLIVGLGNPGKQYDNTRHNMGFMVLDYYADLKKIKFSKQKFDGLYAEFIVKDEKGNPFKTTKIYEFIRRSNKKICRFL